MKKFVNIIKYDDTYYNSSWRNNTKYFMLDVLEENKIIEERFFRSVINGTQLRVEYNLIFTQSYTD